MIKYRPNEAVCEAVNNSLKAGLNSSYGNNKEVFPDMTQVKSARIEPGFVGDQTQADMQNYYFDLYNATQKDIVDTILKLLNSQSGNLQDNNQTFIYNGGSPTYLIITLKNSKTISLFVVNQPDDSQNEVVCISGTFLINQKTEDNPTLVAFMQNRNENTDYVALEKFLQHKER